MSFYIRNVQTHNFFKILHTIFMQLRVLRVNPTELAVQKGRLQLQGGDVEHPRAIVHNSINPRAI